MQAAAGMFTYFYILNDYGMKPMTLFWLTTENGIMPKNTDQYNIYWENYGNTNWKNYTEDISITYSTDSF